MATIKSKISEEVESQFTSMIDMVFLLVIFFIVQPFKAPEMRMRAELPKTDTSTSSSDIVPVRLRVVALQGNRGAWIVDNREVRQDDVMVLANAIWDAAGKNPETSVTIEPDPNVKFDYVLRALDACGVAQMTKVGFAQPILRPD